MGTLVPTKMLLLVQHSREERKSRPGPQHLEISVSCGRLMPTCSRNKDCSSRTAVFCGQHRLRQALGGHVIYTDNSFNFQNCLMRSMWVRKLTLSRGFGDLLQITGPEGEGETEEQALSFLASGTVTLQLSLHPPYMMLTGQGNIEACYQWLSWIPILGTVVRDYGDLFSFYSPHNFKHRLGSV